MQGGCLRSNSGSSPWPGVPLGVALHLRTQLLHLYNGDESNSAGWLCDAGPGLGLAGREQWQLLVR